MPIICEGCGQRLVIPEGYRRNKIQCACGVICQVPESQRPSADAPAPRREANGAKPAVEEDADTWLLADAPSSPPPTDSPRASKAAKADKTASKRKQPANEMRFPCRRCGRPVRRQGECPDCNPDAGAAATKQELVYWPSVDEPDTPPNEDAEDGTPYAVEGADEVRCPKCAFMLPPGSVLCVRCGYHLQKRKKITKTYQPIARVWETNVSFQTRFLSFCLCEAVFGMLGLVGVFWGGASLSVFIGSFLGMSAMLAFLMGTFDRIQLTRDQRGRVQLTKTWRVAFLPRAPQTHEVQGYEGIISGQYHAVTTTEGWILLFLLFFALIPGLIWWYLVFHRITYRVALTRDHGYAAYTVYSGASETQMRDIAHALREASGLRLEDG